MHGNTLMPHGDNRNRQGFPHREGTTLGTEYLHLVQLTIVHKLGQLRDHRHRQMAPHSICLLGMWNRWGFGGRL